MTRIYEKNKKSDKRNHEQETWESNTAKKPIVRKEKGTNHLDSSLYTINH